MLPEVRNNTLAKIQKTTKAVEIRRNAIEFPEVENALSKVELSIFVATTKDSVASMETANLVSSLKLVMNYIKRDIGLTRELDEYDITRFLDVLRKYYSELSLSEVKLAFELSSVGELNDFLPKNADGSVRNGHYQQFNVEYYTKILTAYRNKKNKVVTKAFTALPKRASKISIEERKQLHNGNLHNLTRAFLRYKYSGRYVTNGVEEYLHYRELEKTILAPKIHVSDSDKERALSLVYQKSAKRLITKFQADMISKGGKESKDIQTDAFFIARRRAIIKCFDYMIESEIQINKYLKFV